MTKKGGGRGLEVEFQVSPGAVGAESDLREDGWVCVTEETDTHVFPQLRPQPRSPSEDT